jgi:hypothetical protein
VKKAALRGILLSVPLTKYYSGGQINNKTVEACGTYRETVLCGGFGGETVGKEPLRRFRRRWEDNIKMDMKDE